MGTIKRVLYINSRDDFKRLIGTKKGNRIQSLCCTFFPSFSANAFSTSMIAEQ